MKFPLLLALTCLVTVAVSAQTKAFRFAFISDTHIGSPNGGAEEDLRRTVRDINQMKDVAFVVITGDITELGTNKELQLAKQILDSLNITYYIIPGNHDTGWSESGGLSFTNTFGNDRFHFNSNGIHFIGCASGPYVRMSDGHVPRDAMNWLNKELKSVKKNEPVIFLNHYPLDNGLDNWYEVIDMVKKHNTVLALCGHGHSNRPVQAEDIPAVMGRSNLRAKAAAGGYNVVDVRLDSFVFIERNPLTTEERKWKTVEFRSQSYNTSNQYQRPDFSINDQYKNVRAKWTYASSANVISTPAAFGNSILFGNQSGSIEAIKASNGKRTWHYQTGGPIYSSPAVAGNRIIVGSADKHVYCLNDKGRLQWKFATNAAVLGSPLIDSYTCYIGGSDSNFRAIDINTGKQVWAFNQLQGPVVSQPVVYGDMIVFGAWDTYLYALNKKDGSLRWKWSNGSAIRNYSPAACIPVIRDGVVYIVAPDRYLTAIDALSGKVLWRTNQSTVRESIGISEDGSTVYGKTMNDTLVGFSANKQQPIVAWKMNVGYGYEHAPSMLIERKGIIYFGTRNGVVYAINKNNHTIQWAYKIDNSMVNTVRLLNDKQLMVSTMDGKVVLLEWRN
jgi:outer membrane protein assembly factor BamB/predicted phosphodiesterase